MDITIEIDNTVINVRTAALIKINGKVLVHHSLTYISENDHITLPGGRVQTGEDSISALKREIKEEIGLDVRFIKNIAIMESFFEMKGKQYHEFLFVNEMNFIDSSITEQSNILPIEERKIGKLEFKWIDIDKLDTYTFVPAKLKAQIVNNNGTVHLINDER